MPDADGGSKTVDVIFVPAAAIWRDMAGSTVKARPMGNCGGPAEDTARAGFEASLDREDVNREDEHRICGLPALINLLIELATMIRYTPPSYPATP